MSSKIETNECTSETSSNFSILKRLKETKRKRSARSLSYCISGEEVCAHCIHAKEAKEFLKIHLQRSAPCGGCMDNMTLEACVQHLFDFCLSDSSSRRTKEINGDIYIDNLTSSEIIDATLRTNEIINWLICNFSFDLKDEKSYEDLLIFLKLHRSQEQRNDQRKHMTDRSLGEKFGRIFASSLCTLYNVYFQDDIVFPSHNSDDAKDMKYNQITSFLCELGNVVAASVRHSGSCKFQTDVYIGEGAEEKNVTLVTKPDFALEDADGTASIIVKLCNLPVTVSTDLKSCNSNKHSDSVSLSSSDDEENIKERFLPKISQDRATCDACYNILGGTHMVELLALLDHNLQHGMVEEDNNNLTGIGMFMQETKQMQEQIESLEEMVRTQQEELDQLKVATNSLTRTPVGFTATMSQGHHHPSDYSIVRFPVLTANVGDHYRSDLSQFECPQTGMYYFSISLNSGPIDVDDYATSVADIIVNQKPVGISFCGNVGEDHVYLQCSTSVVVECEENERVWVRSRGSSTQFAGDSEKLSVFSGFLIEAL